MRSAMPRRLVPEIVLWPETEDGYAEITIEIAGRLVASRVIGPWFSGDQRETDALLAEFLRKC